MRSYLICLLNNIVYLLVVVLGRVNTTDIIIITIIEAANKIEVIINAKHFLSCILEEK